MSSPANPDQTPDKTPNQPPNSASTSANSAAGRPEGSPREGNARDGKTANQPPQTPNPALPDDPTRTLWNESLPNDPTLTQWTAYPPPPQGHPPAQPPGQRPAQKYGPPPAQQPVQRPAPQQYGPPPVQQPVQSGAPAQQYGPPAVQQPVQQAGQQAGQQPAQQPEQQISAPKPARRRMRSLFWPGFALGFLLLASLSCGLSAAALGLNRLSLDDFRGGTGASWTPSPITPTPAVAEANPDEAVGAPATGGSTRFAVGQTVRNVTNSRVNIRMSPGYLGKPASDVIGQVGPGETLQILGDPTAVDDLIWWHIQTTGSGQPIVGWMAEATASGVQILGESR